MKDHTEIPSLSEPRKTVVIETGDTVNDMYGYTGVFVVEEIRDDGWIWGSGMNVPYTMTKKKNFIDNNFIWKVGSKNLN